MVKDAWDKRIIMSRTVIAKNGWFILFRVEYHDPIKRPSDEDQTSTLVLTYVRTLALNQQSMPTISK